MTTICVFFRQGFLPPTLPCGSSQVGKLRHGRERHMLKSHFREANLRDLGNEKKNNPKFLYPIYTPR